MTTAVIVVPRGAVVNEPIEVRYSTYGPLLAHTLVVLEDEANLPAVVEDFAGTPGFTSGVVERDRAEYLERRADAVYNTGDGG